MTPTASICVTSQPRASSFAGDVPQPSGTTEIRAPQPIRRAIAIQEELMSRIPSHTTQDAPAASRPLLEDMLQLSPTGRLLNMHAQMAHSPAVMEATSWYSPHDLAMIR